MSKAYPGYVVVVMLLAYICSFIDRTIINLLVTTIKQDLHLTDTQVSLLQGLAFAVFYVGAGLYIGRLADKHSRRLLISGGLVLWCLATAGGVLATSFATLFALRVLVGVGESTLTPSATSMLGDYFSKRRIGLVMSVYTLGPFLGSAIALIAGGYLLDSLIARPQITVPVLGVLRPWQAAFLVVGLPGLLIAALVFFTVREPARTEVIIEASSTGEGSGFGATVRYFRQHLNVYGRIFLASAMLSLVGYGMTAWLPTYYLREFGATNTQLGSMIGMSILIGGPIGVLAGGVLVDWMQGRRADGPVLIGMIAALGTLVFASCVVLADTMTLSATMIVFAYIFKGMPLGMFYVSIYLTTPNRMRGQITAIYLFIDAMIGLGFGPTAIALFTDYVYRDEARLGHSLLMVVGLACATSFVAFLTVRRRFVDLVAAGGH